MLRALERATRTVSALSVALDLHQPLSGQSPPTRPDADFRSPTSAAVDGALHYMEGTAQRAPDLADRTGLVLGFGDEGHADSEMPRASASLTAAPSDLYMRENYRAHRRGRGTCSWCSCYFFLPGDDCAGAGAGGGTSDVAMS